MSIQAMIWAYAQPIKPTARKFILVTLANYADGHGYCYPGQKTIAEDTSQGESTVRNHLKALEDDGYITRAERRRENGMRTSDGYTLQIQPPDLSACDSHRQISAKSPPDFSGVIEPSEEPSVSATPAENQRLIESEGIDAESVFERVCSAMGVQPETIAGQMRYVEAWLAMGALPQTDIYPVVDKIMGRRGEEPPESITYFTPAIKEARDKRENPNKGLVPQKTKERPPQTRPFETWTDDEKTEFGEIIGRVGEGTAVRNFRYSYRQLNAYKQWVSERNTA